MADDADDLKQAAQGIVMSDPMMAIGAGMAKLGDHLPMLTDLIRKAPAPNDVKDWLWHQWHAAPSPAHLVSSLKHAPIPDATKAQLAKLKARAQ